MASKLYNRARMTVTSTGTGALSLGVAVAGYQTFSSSGAQNNDVVSYCIEDGLNWEVGAGTYNSVAGTLSRTVTQSFNGTTYGTSAISVTTNAQVYITALAADIVVNGGALGTPSSGTLTNCAGLPAASVTGLAASATTDTTNASNISSGTINSARLPSISLTSGVTGTLPVANGGTGLTSLTAGYIPYGNGTGAFSSSSSLYFSGSALGVGTSSPGYLIHAYGSGANAAQIKVQNVGSVTDSRALVTFTSNASTYGAGIFLTSTADSAYVTSALNLFTFDNQPIAFGTGNALKMTLDLSGNLGLGVTPSAWGPNIKALDINTCGAISTFSNGTGSQQVGISNNAYLDSAWIWRYKYSSVGSARFNIDGNGFIWLQAASGTAGNAISFTQAMTLTSGGSLLVGTTTDSGSRVTVAGAATFSGAYAGVNLGEANCGIYGTSATTNAANMVFYTAGSERARIDSSGNLLVGTTTAGALLTVAGPVALAAPSTKTANYSLVAADSSLIFNGSGTITLTLQAASSYPGRILHVKTIAAQAVNSASSNVVPIGSATAGTAILTNTAGKWATLQSDGTNWIIMAAN